MREKKISIQGEDLETLHKNNEYTFSMNSMIKSLDIFKEEYRDKYKINVVEFYNRVNDIK